MESMESMELEDVERPQRLPHQPARPYQGRARGNPMSIGRVLGQFSCFPTPRFIRLGIAVFLVIFLFFNIIYFTRPRRYQSTTAHSRNLDTTDTFANFAHRDTCDISSHSIHYSPMLLHQPLCTDRSELLTAMSSGGRIGIDQPYVPLGCSMRWYKTNEICDILGRFDKVLMVGDSMIGHVVGAINVLIREDLGYGAVTGWNLDETERKECFCNEQFDVKSCSPQGIYRTGDVYEHDPDSIKCPAGTVNVIVEQILKDPISNDELDRLQLALERSTTKRIAIVFGQGLWSDLSVPATVTWLDIILKSVASSAQSSSRLVRRDPYGSSPPHAQYDSYSPSPHPMPRELFPTAKEGESDWPIRALFMTPSAAGINKPDEYLVKQGNKALRKFEEETKGEMRRRGVEHLGTWNMSVQASSKDGVHMDLRGNLVKAMMVVNWLDMLSVS